MQSQTINFDYIIVGAGTFGLSTCFFLSQQLPQAKIALIQQFKIGHDDGSSHSQSRIIRTVYKKEFYRNFCIQGKEYWKYVQDLLGEKFILDNPVVSFIENQQNFQMINKVAEGSNGQLTKLTNEEVRNKFPTAPRINNKNMNFFDTNSGVILAEKYQKAILSNLQSNKKISIFENHNLTKINNGEKLCIIHLTNQKNKPQQFKAKKILLSCGRWISDLIPQMKKLTKVNRQVVGYFQMKSPELYKIGNFPCWQHVETDSQKRYYGLPDVTGLGIKFARHSVHCTLDNKGEQDLVQKLEKDLIQRAQRYFGRQNIERHVKFQKCYYTSTRTEDFIVDWSDQKQNVLVLSACSGHGFKFSSIIGKVAADLLEKDSSLTIFMDNRQLFRFFYHSGVDLSHE